VARFTGQECDITDLEVEGFAARRNQPARSLQDDMESGALLRGETLTPRRVPGCPGGMRRADPHGGDSVAENVHISTLLPNPICLDDQILMTAF
jgi:hypothetical protein